VTTTRRALLRGLGAAALGTSLLGHAVAAGDPLADLSVEDADGQTRSLASLRDQPLVLVIADRRAAAQARAWGTRLAGANLPLAPRAAPGTVVWLSVADLGGVPDYARDAARARLRESEETRSEGERRLRSPLLLDWDGRLAREYGAGRGEALVLVLTPTHEPIRRERGAPTDAAVARVREAIASITPR